MKTTFYVTLDEREDGTKTWMAKCHRCDAILCGERAQPIPVIRAKTHIPASQIHTLNRDVQRAWDSARKNNHPFVLPTPDLELITVPDHGLQRAVDAHADSCVKRNG